MNIMGVFSNIVLNKLMASYCNEAVAGIGIAKKVDMMSFAPSPQACRRGSSPHWVQLFR
jgi:Na+-driven multidrug efflux pump